MIMRDISALEHDISQLVESGATQQSEVYAEEAVLALERLAAHAKRVSDLALAKDSSLSGLQEKIDECHESCCEARDVISRFQDAAGVQTIDELRIAIRQSAEMRKLCSEFERLNDG